MRLPVLNRTAAMLGVALAAGLCAAWAAREHIQNRIEQIEAQAKVPTAQRVVAAYDLPTGTKLTAEHIAIRQFPVELVSSDSVTPERFTELTGHVLLSPLRAGDPILPVHTVLAHNMPFSSKLTEGRRAITIPVDAINSVSGLLEPGDLIDLYVSFEYQRRRITAPLLQGVLVLATGATTQFTSEGGPTRPGGYSTVTLDTSPEDAIKLVAARQSGMITALLRNPGDNRLNQRAVRGDLASLLGVNVKMPLAATAKTAPVIYGNQAVRRVPSLRPVAPGPKQVNGLFDLPYTPELVSAWMHAASIVRQSAAVPENSESPVLSDMNLLDSSSSPVEVID
ncbi:MAG TPA: Flp pilus assembly protein CpaB [Eoetvoesiella sp.]